MFLSVIHLQKKSNFALLNKSIFCHFMKPSNYSIQTLTSTFDLLITNMIDNKGSIGQEQTVFIILASRELICPLVFGFYSTSDADGKKFYLFFFFFFAMSSSQIDVMDDVSP